MFGVFCFRVDVVGFVVEAEDAVQVRAAFVVEQVADEVDLTAGLMLAVAGLLVDAARELDAVVRDEVVEADRAAAEVDAAEEEVVRVEEADDVAAAVFDSDGLAVARDVLAEAVAAVAARVAAAARVRVTGLAGAAAPVAGMVATLPGIFELPAR